MEKIIGQTDRRFLSGTKGRQEDRGAKLHQERSHSGVSTSLSADLGLFLFDLALQLSFSFS